MTALQEREIKNEMINCIERMDGRDIQILLNVAKRFISIDDLEDELEEAADLKTIEESEKEFAAGEALILEI